MVQTIVEIGWRLVVILGYLSVGLTLYCYGILWLRDKPEAAAEAVTSGRKTRAIVTAFGNMVFFFLALVAILVVTAGFLFLAHWLLPSGGG